MPKPSGVFRMLVLRIDAVLHSTQQVLNLARANFCLGVLKRNGPAETVLRMFEPGARFVDVAEKVCGLAKQSRKTHHLVRFTRRQASSGLAPLQSRSRDGKLFGKLIERYVDLLSQFFEVSEGHSLLYSANQFRGMPGFGSNRFPFDR